MKRNMPQLDEQRSALRLPAQGVVRVRLESTLLEGECENRSEAGVHLLSLDELRVVVEFEDEPGSSPRTGRLVRVQRMDQERSGLAIEFDPV
jgi:hypothetical protein